MPRRSDIRGLCVILDDDLLRTDAEAVVREAFAAGARFFQYRSKQQTRREIYRTSLALRGILRDVGALFIVNDHADIAAAVMADGVHLGQDDLPARHARALLGSDRIIGISTHSVAEAREAVRDGADYIGFGPVFVTATKDAGPVQGLDRLREVRKVVSLPLIAIGGISVRNIGDVVRAGADGAAVIGALREAPTVGGAVRDLQEHLQHPDT